MTSFNPIGPYGSSNFYNPNQIAEFSGPGQVQAQPANDLIKADIAKLAFLANQPQTFGVQGGEAQLLQNLTSQFLNQANYQPQQQDPSQEASQLSYLADNLASQLNGNYQPSYGGGGFGGGLNTGIGLPPQQEPYTPYGGGGYGGYGGGLNTGSALPPQQQPYTPYGGGGFGGGLNTGIALPPQQEPYNPQYPFGAPPPEGSTPVGSPQPGTGTPPGTVTPSGTDTPPGFSIVGTPSTQQEVVTSADSGASIVLQNGKLNGTVNGSTKSTNIDSSDGNLFSTSQVVDGGFQLADTLGGTNPDGSPAVSTFSAEVSGHKVTVEHNADKAPLVYVDDKQVLIGGSDGPVTYNSDGSVSIVGKTKDGSEVTAKVGDDNSGLGVTITGLNNITSGGGTASGKFLTGVKLNTDDTGVATDNGLELQSNSGVRNDSGKGVGINIGHEDAHTDQHFSRTTDDLIDFNKDFQGGYQIGAVVDPNDSRSVQQYNLEIAGQNIQVTRGTDGAKPTILVDGKPLGPNQTIGSISTDDAGNLTVSTKDPSGAQATTVIGQDDSGLTLHIKDVANVNHIGGDLAHDVNNTN